MTKTETAPHIPATLSTELRAFVMDLASKSHRGNDAWLSYEAAKAKLWLATDTADEYELAIQEYADAVKI